MNRRLVLEAPQPVTPEWAALVAGARIGDVLRLGQRRDAWRVTKIEGLAVEMVLV